MSSFLLLDNSEEAAAYEELKSQYVKHTQDFLTMSKIACLISSLADSYTVRAPLF